MLDKDEIKPTVIESEVEINTLSNLADIKASLLQVEVPTTLDLGEGKIITLSKWTGKQLITYGKQIEEISEDINNQGDPELLLQKIPNAIIEYLIKPNVLDFDTYYFNSHEVKHILFNIRKISIPSLDVSYDFTCGGIINNMPCTVNDNVKIPFSNIIENIHKYNNGDLKLSNGITLSITDIRNVDTMKDKDKLDDSVSLINEICMRVNKVTYGAQSTEVIVFDELLDILLHLPSEIFTELIDIYVSQFGFTQSIESIEYECPICKTKHKMILDDALLYVEGI